MNDHHHEIFLFVLKLADKGSKLYNNSFKPNSTALKLHLILSPY